MAETGRAFKGKLDIVQGSGNHKDLRRDLITHGLFLQIIDDIIMAF